jgi:H+/Cl- antiporter ClcA
LADQSAESAEELRKRKMLEAQQRGLLGTGGSAAASSLFGSPLSGFNGTGLLR